MVDKKVKNAKIKLENKAVFKKKKEKIKMEKMLNKIQKIEGDLFIVNLKLEKELDIKGNVAELMDFYKNADDVDQLIFENVVKNALETVLVNADMVANDRGICLSCQRVSTDLTRHLCGIKESVVA